MNDFVKQNKILITVVLSILIGLTWSLVYIYVLMPMFPYPSWFYKWVNSNEILIFAGIFVGMILGKDLKERLILLVISSACSIAVSILISFLRFIFGNLSI